MTTNFNLNPGITIGEIYEHLQPELQRYALYLCRDEDVANDLVSETMLRAMINLSLVGTLGQNQWRAWLYRVLKNLYFDELRVKRRQQEFLELMGRIDNEPGFFSLPMDVLEQVPYRFRELVNLRYCLGMSSEEIGEILGIPAATARSRLHLATLWLRKNLVR